ncbi:MAG: hypothetical protein K1X95_05470 [Acidimicrobiia bacterium]|nr:hypothetical protein [Acidimicrobiia bacterium]
MTHARVRRVVWAVRHPRGGRRWRRVLGPPLVVIGVVYGLFAVDAFVYRSEANVDTARMQVGTVDERAELWRSPPYGRGDRAFRWGMSENGDQETAYSPDQVQALPAWLPLYDDLDVDLVRLFPGWRYFQPHGPGSLDTGYYVGRLIEGFSDAGYKIEVSPWNAPMWGVTGGPWRLWGPNVFQYMPPLAWADADGPYCAWLAAMHREYPAITVWQVWNEPDYPHGNPDATWNPLVYRFWRGTALRYGELLGACTRQIHSWGDGSTVSTGGVSQPSYLDAVLAAPGAGDVDVLDMHFAAGSGLPDPDTELDRLLRMAHEQVGVAGARGMQHPGLSVSELSFAYSPAGADAQADFVAKSYATAVALGWDHMSWFTINAARNYYDTGLVDFGAGDDPGPPRPSYSAYRFNKVALSRATALGLSGDGTTVRSADFTTGDGRPVFAAWSPGGRGGTVPWPADAGPGEVYDHRGNKIADVAAGASVELAPTLRYVVPSGWVR